MRFPVRGWIGLYGPSPGNESEIVSDFSRDMIVADRQLPISIEVRLRHVRSD